LRRKILVLRSSRTVFSDVENLIADAAASASEKRRNRASRGVRGERKKAVFSADSLAELLYYLLLNAKGCRRLAEDFPLNGKK
jgi:hypothetical protein